MKKLNSRGFTLIEILLVLGIIAAVIGIAITRIHRKDNNIRGAVRHLTTTVREIRNHAKLANATYRLVVNLDSEPAKYYVEFAAGHIVRESKEDIENQEKMDKDKRPADPFRRDSFFGKKDSELPKGFKFGSLETIDMQEPLKTGVGYIYFSPEGFAEYSALQITDSKDLTWTLVFSPLTGQADIIQKAQALKDIKQ